MTELIPLCPVTLQEQLYQELVTQIQNGKYKPGDRIPSELQLSELYSVSRITVRHALAKLVDEQIIIKRPGKGSFVKSPVFVEHFSSGGSFTDTCFRMNATPSTQIIRKEVIPSHSASMKNRLGENVIHITRLRLVNHTPCIVEEDFFPVSFEFLLHTDIENRSLLAYVYEQTGLLPAKFEDFFRTTHADKEYASLLEYSMGQALLEVTQNVMTQDESLIYINQQYILTERYVYAVRSSR